VDIALSFVTVLGSDWGWLQGKQRNDTSQFGEDGLIEAVLDKIGITNRWCFEVGAADGLFYSNTKRLRDDGWHAVLIDANQEHVEAIGRLGEPNTIPVHESIGPDSLDRILADAGAPLELDFGVIDIDGQDWWAWNGMTSHRPRVMLVEYLYLNKTFTDPNFIPPQDGQGQAGRDAIIALGEAKGYIAVASTLCNLLFVERTACRSN
jgi:hypothetical protein